MDTHAKWPTVPEKLYAMFWWNHIARRQVPPMYQHGLEVTDPIRQFNDYGYTQCSTISGINCGIWHNMGFPVRYWDIAGHTVPEVQYDGHWHMYDDSMSNIYFTCDGQRVAGVEDIRQELGCRASGGKVEKYHLVLFHSLSSNGPNGFSTGAEACRTLSDLAGCYRNGSWVWWMSNWDWGHRYILNPKPHEVYTRYYTRLEGFDPKIAYDAKAWKNDPRFFVPNPNTPSKDQSDPEAVVGVRRIRGTGQWDYQPSLTTTDSKDYHSLANIAFEKPAGLRPQQAGRIAEAVFKVQGANVITSQEIDAKLARKSADDQASIAVSTDNGGHWNTVWTASAAGGVPARLTLIKEVNGAYEILVKVQMTAKANASDLVLKRLHFRTFTQINSKTQPRLNIGKNTIYVGAGEQTESTVLWPELQADKYKELVFDANNIRTEKIHPLYDPTLLPADLNKEAHLVYKFQAPGDITRLTIGARYRHLVNSDQGAIAFLYSLDEGKTWTQAWRFRGTPNANPKKPMGSCVDAIHHEPIAIRKGHKSVLVKYSLDKFGLWNLRAEANYLPGDVTFKPLEVTFTWNERQEDYSLVKRSHTQLIDRLPARYEIHVAGADHPEMVSLRIKQQGAATAASTQPVEYGYSDDKDVGGQKYVGAWVTYGKDIALGKKYSFSKPSVQCWAGCYDKDLTRLTDGYIGAPAGGGYFWSKSAGWDDKTPEFGIDLDLGHETPCAAIGLSSCGDEALTGRLAANQSVEVFVSSDGKDYKSIGLVNFKPRFKDIPYNYMLGDEETMPTGIFYVPLPKPVSARYVRYKVKFKGGMFFTTELLVYDCVTVKPFDIRIALPDELPQTAK
jgi:hypothetical protein